MDHIYPTKDYKVYKIKDEFNKLSSSVLHSGLPKDQDEITKTANVSDEKLRRTFLEVYKTYEEYGSIEASNGPSPFSSFPKEALELNFVKAFQDGNWSFKEPRIPEMMKFYPKLIKNECSNLEVFEECVITVRFYEQFKYTPSMRNHPRFHQEYLVLGSNFLTDLRERFYCPCNYGPFFDISDNPLAITKVDQNAADPGFFFIYDTFYNDTRNPANPDYSDTILNWFKRYDYVREFKTGVMQDTKFEDLEIRVGNPCVYQHHGSCEHFFCITSVDLLDSSNSLVRTNYPLLNASGKKRSTLCDLCGQIDSSILVTNCALHVKDPMKVCNDCFISFHYQSDGITKTCSFNAYRIFSVRPDN